LARKVGATAQANLKSQSQTRNPFPIPIPKTQCPGGMEEEGSRIENKLPEVIQLA